MGSNSRRAWNVVQPLRGRKPDSVERPPQRAKDRVPSPCKPSENWRSDWWGCGDSPEDLWAGQLPFLFQDTQGAPMRVPLEGPVLSVDLLARWQFLSWHDSAIDGWNILSGGDVAVAGWHKGMVLFAIIPGHFHWGMESRAGKRNSRVLA